MGLCWHRQRPLPYGHHQVTWNCRTDIFTGLNFKQKVLIFGSLCFMGELPGSHFHSTWGQTQQRRARFSAAFVISKETVCQHHICQPNLCQHLKHPPPVRTCLCSAATCFSCRSCSPWEGVCVTVKLSMCSDLGKMFLFPIYCWFCFFFFFLLEACIWILEHSAVSLFTCQSQESVLRSP